MVKHSVIIYLHHITNQKWKEQGKWPNERYSYSTPGMLLFCQWFSKIIFYGSLSIFWVNDAHHRLIMSMRRQMDLVTVLCPFRVIDAHHRLIMSMCSQTELVTVLCPFWVTDAHHRLIMSMCRQTELVTVLCPFWVNDAQHWLSTRTYVNVYANRICNGWPSVL